MSFQITKNQIHITKGDTFSLPVHFHQPINGAKILIEVFKEGTLLPIIRKEITEHSDPLAGKSLLHLEKELTNIPGGTYFIQMSITLLDGSKYTFYPPNPGAVAHLIIQELKTV